jgi:hypothetical protein
LNLEDTCIKKVDEQFNISSYFPLKLR